MPLSVISLHIPTYTISAILTDTHFFLSLLNTVCYNFLCKLSMHVSTLGMCISVICTVWVCYVLYVNTHDLLKAVFAHCYFLIESFKMAQPWLPCVPVSTYVCVSV